MQSSTRASLPAARRTVLDWIVMDVIDMPFEVHFVFDLVLPEPPLPNPVLTFSIP